MGGFPRARHQKNGLLSYIIFPNYLSYFFVMPRASVARRRVLTNDGPCYLSLIHSRYAHHAAQRDRPRVDGGRVRVW